MEPFGGSDASGYPGAIKVAVAFPNGVHDDGELARHCYGGTTQTDPHRHCASPTSQRAVGDLEQLRTWLVGKSQDGELANMRMEPTRR